MLNVPSLLSLSFVTDSAVTSEGTAIKLSKVYARLLATAPYTSILVSAQYTSTQVSAPYTIHLFPSICIVLNPVLLTLTLSSKFGLAPPMESLSVKEVMEASGFLSPMSCHKQMHTGTWVNFFQSAHILKGELHLNNLKGLFNKKMSIVQISYLG